MATPRALLPECRHAVTGSDDFADVAYDLVAAAHRRGHLLRACLRRWRATPDVNTRVALTASSQRIADAFAHLKRKSTVLSKWRTRTEEAQVEAALTQVARRLHERHSLRRTMRGWRQLIPALRARRQHRARLLGHGEHRVVVPSPLARFTLATLMPLCLRRFRVWRQFATPRANCRRLMGMAWRRHVASALHKWQRVVQRNQRRAICVDAICATRSRATASIAFLRWLSVTTRSRLQRHARLGHALRVLHQRTTRAQAGHAFHRWRANAGVRPLRRAAERQLTLQCYMAWRGACAARRVTATRVGYADAWRAYMRLGVAWSQWRSRLVARRQADAAILHYASRLQRRMLCAWRCEAKERKYERALETLGVATRRKLLLRHAFQQLCLHARCPAAPAPPALLLEDTRKPSPTPDASPPRQPSVGLPSPSTVDPEPLRPLPMPTLHAAVSPQRARSEASPAKEQLEGPTPRAAGVDAALAPQREGPHAPVVVNAVPLPMGVVVAASAASSALTTSHVDPTSAGGSVGTSTPPPEWHDASAATHPTARSPDHLVAMTGKPAAAENAFELHVRRALAELAHLASTAAADDVERRSLQRHLASLDGVASPVAEETQRALHHRVTELRQRSERRRWLRQYAAEVAASLTSDTNASPAPSFGGTAPVSFVH